MPFTIKDIENLTGIKAHTIRIWEQRYSFLKPQRTQTNIRLYSNDDLKIILNVSMLYKSGFKISRINKMNYTEIDENIISLTSAEAKLERIVNELIQKMAEVDMDQFEKVLNNCISSSGIEKTILQIIFPFLERIGILWLTNNINPAQEHLVSNIVRQKILVGIENIKTKSLRQKVICLFLPVGEYHELSLLFITYLLKKHGISVVYLGASIPLEDVDFIVQLKKPDYLYTHLTTAGHNFNFDKFIASVSKKFNSITVVISGRLTNAYQKRIPQNISFKKSLREVMDFVESL